MKTTTLYWSLPGYEGSYDGDLEAEVDAEGARFTLITHNPNCGGASDAGSYTADELRRRAVREPITAEHCDDVLDVIARFGPSGTSR